MPLPVPPSAALPDPEPEEFERWLSPLQAFPEGVPTTQISGLLRKLQDGIITAAGRAIWWDDEAVREERPIMAVQMRWWHRAQSAQHYLGSLWTDGEETFMVLDESGMEDIAVNFYGLRFERSSLLDAVPGLRNRIAIPAALSTLQPAKIDLAGVPVLSDPDRATPPKPSGATGSPDDRKMLPRPRDRDMERFSELLLAVYGDEHSEVFAYRALLALYPDNYVSREYFLGIFRAKRGRKPPGRTKGKKSSDG